MWRWVTVFGAVGSALAAGCEGEPVGPTREVGAMCATAGAQLCLDNAVWECARDMPGRARRVRTCTSEQICANAACLACRPNDRRCSETGAPEVCAADGSAWTGGEACASGLACQGGNCVNLCSDVASTNSYLGCEYWAVPTLNRGLGGLSRDPARPVTQAGAVGVDGFQYAVVLSNPYALTANVRIEGGALPSPLTLAVPPRQLQTVRLPWIPTVSYVQRTGATMLSAVESSLTTNGAYHVTSDVPLVAYQFNPLTFRDSRRASCDPSDTTCYSYTNDASLLLPAHALTGDYIAVAFPSQASVQNEMLAGFSPGFVTLVGTTETPANVTITPTAYTLAGPGVAAVDTPGQPVRFRLARGQVLQLLSGAPNVTNPMVCTRERFYPGTTNTLEACQPSARFDLTGSVIQADQPIAAFGGHNCAFVPFNRLACDHLEEQLIPRQSVGRQYVLAPTQSQLPSREPNLVRLVSEANNNALTFDPPVPGAPAMLQRGQVAELVLAAPTVVQGSGAFTVTQFLVGQNYASNADELPPGTAGDPSMAFVPPVEQWRRSYDVLTPESYTRSYVQVYAPRDQAVRLDGMPLTRERADLTFLRAGAYDIYRVDVSARPGAHQIESEQRVGVLVYGFGSYTSYMYVGGLDLTRIATPG